jgi:DNA-binding response OmpR family regulator
LPDRPSVLIIDDDASHLKLYSWILEGQGFTAFTTLVGTQTPTFDDHPDVDLVILDYSFRTGVKATDVAQHIRKRWTNMPIIVLSDMMWMPDDIASLANGFVRKGEPEQLVAKVAEMTGHNASAAGS